MWNFPAAGMTQQSAYTPSPLPAMMRTRIFPTEPDSDTTLKWPSCNTLECATCSPRRPQKHWPQDLESLTHSLPTMMRTRNFPTEPDSLQVAGSTGTRLTQVNSSPPSILLSPPSKSCWLFIKSTRNLISNSWFLTLW